MRWCPGDSLGILKIERIPRMLAALSLCDAHLSWELGSLLAGHSTRTWLVEPAAVKVAAWLLCVFTEAASWAWGPLVAASGLFPSQA